MRKEISQHSEPKITCYLGEECKLCFLSVHFFFVAFVVCVCWWLLLLVALVLLVAFVLREVSIEGVPLLVKSVFVMVTILALSSQSSFFHTSFIPAFFLIFLPLMTGKDKTAKSGKSKKALEAEFLAALQVYLSLYTF